MSSLWIGEGLSAMCELSIRSFLAHGHEFHLYTYGRLSHVPPGTVVRDASEIVPQKLIFRHREGGSYSGFSDLFRYELLRQHGGWWADLDVICLKPLPEPDQYAIATLFRAPGTIAATGCVLFSRPSSPLTELLCQRVYRKDWSDISYCEIGPDLIADGVSDLGLEEHLTPWQTFCPIPCFRWFDTFLPGRTQEFPPETLTVHYWHEMWRQAQLDPNEDFGPHSLYERLKRRYGVERRRV